MSLLNILRKSTTLATATAKPVPPKFSSEHALLERSLAKLRADRDAAVARHDSTWFAAGGMGHNDATRRARAEIDALEREIVDVRNKLAPHRQAHGKATRNALQPAVDRAAAEALEALALLESAIKNFNSLRTTVRRAGGSAPDQIHGGLIRAIRAPLKAALGAS